MGGFDVVVGELGVGGVAVVEGLTPVVGTVEVVTGGAVVEPVADGPAAGGVDEHAATAVTTAASTVQLDVGGRWRRLGLWRIVRA